MGRRMCLWNGFLASAPGHPFLAKVIERAVNNIRNQYTSVDMDRLFCPNPEQSILHAFPILFTTGPCILGAMVNEALGRDAQSQFEAGELPKAENAPGRSIVLSQNKNDVRRGKVCFKSVLLASRFEVSLTFACTSPRIIFRWELIVSLLTKRTLLLPLPTSPATTTNEDCKTKRPITARSRVGRRGIPMEVGICMSSRQKQMKTSES